MSSVWTEKRRKGQLCRDLGQGALDQEWTGLAEVAKGILSRELSKIYHLSWPRLETLALSLFYVLGMHSYLLIAGTFG